MSTGRDPGPTEPPGRGAPPTGRDRDVATKPVETATGLGVAAGAQFAALIVSSVFAVAFLVDRGADGKGTDLKGGVAPVVLSLIPLWACLVGGVFLAGRRRHQSLRSLVGLAVRGTDPLYVGLGVVLQYAGALLYLPFSVDSERLERPARELVDRAGGLGAGFALLAVALVVIAPAVEELFYRGLVVGSIGRVFERRNVATARILAVALGAVWFAGVHFEWLQFPALLLVGLACGTIAVRTGRIVPAYFVHLGFNLVTVVELGRRLR